MRRRSARRCAQAGTSATMVINDMVAEMRGTGQPVIDVAGGTPHFDTPPHITAAAVAALESGFTRYTPSRGIPDLLEAIATKLQSDNGVAVDPATEIIVTPSSKHALFMAFMTILEPDDEILIPTPSWVSYESMARLAGARPVPVALSAVDGFALTAERLRQHLTEHTRAIMINTPCNPTGRMLSPAEATAVATVADDHDLLIITDEIYEKIVTGDTAHLSLAARPDCAGRTITVNGFSKAYAMPGWRLGYVAGPIDVMSAMVAVQQQTVACAGSFVQRGGVAALTGSQAPVREMTARYATHARLVVDALNALPGVTCHPPEGAFYAFPDIRGTGVPDDATFAARLLKETAVAVTPGSAFGPGGEGHVRISFAATTDVIKQALGRIAEFVDGIAG